MVTNPKPVGAIAGRIFIVAGIAVALPLTASRAVDYVDVPAAPVHPVRAPAPVALPAAAAAVVQPVAPVVPVAAVPRAARSPVSGEPTQIVADDNLTISGDFITIDGQRKRWEELTPAEKQRVRTAVAKARAAIANVHIDRDRIMRSVASIPNQVQLEKIAQDVARAQSNVAESMRNLEEHRDELRRIGFDPSIIEGRVAEAMRSMQNVDMQAVQRSVSAVDPAKIQKSIDSAERGAEAARAELDGLQAKMDADRN